MKTAPAPDAALLMIEFQNEWLAPDGRLHHLFSDRALLATTVTNSGLALMVARQAGMHVIHTAMGFSPDYQELGSGGAGLRGAIAKFHTWQHQGREIAKSFAPLAGEFVIDRKVAASAFTATPLDMYLRNNGINRLYLAGFALHVCISATGWAAHDLGYEVTILDDACSAFTASQQQFVLEHVVHHFGNTCSTQYFVNQFTGASHVSAN